MGVDRGPKSSTIPAICPSAYILYVLLLFPYIATLADQVTFPNPSTNSFNHFAVDSKTGRVFIGAVNRIYQLSPELEVEETVVTGPDNKATDNVNKVLLIDSSTNRLITCGSAQGFCTSRILNNISQAHDVHEPVVANNAEASTVAFIAEGPAKKQVMYVAATYTPNQNGFVLPAVSSRSLEDGNLFSTAQEGTKIFISSLSREQYPVNYVYGFSSEGFSYFLTTQLKNVGSDAYYSKLVRVCHNDENYYSYTEIPITCARNGIDYNLVQAGFVGKGGSKFAKHLGINAHEDILFAAFSSSEDKTTSKPSDTSALCVYSLNDIRRKFTKTIQSCFSGQGMRGIDFISPSNPCISTKLNINEQFCGLDINTPLGGEDAVEAMPVVVFNDRITSMVVPVTSYYNVVFAGTVRGHLKKILVNDATASEYSDNIIEQSTPIKNVIFDSLHSRLYVLTERKLSIVGVQECSVYESCSACLEASDPYCGWCSSEAKCSTQSDCRDGLRGLINWRQKISPHRNDTCAFITQVKPHQLPRTKSTKLNVYIDNLPVDDGQYYCVFRVLAHSITTLATRQSYGVDCDSPPVSTLPPIHEDHHRLKAKLYVRNTQQHNLAVTNFIFYDCSSYSSCTKCASSAYPCEWCLEGDRCTHDSSTYCLSEIFVAINRSENEGRSSCSSFHSKSDSNEILIHSGVTKAIAVKAHITEQVVVQSRFLCEFTIGNKTHRVNAQLLGDTIYCDRFEFTYTSPDPYVTASFKILWAGGSKSLDNPDNIHIFIYRCNNLAHDCGTCLTMPEKYQCGFCHGTDKCELQDKCNLPNTWFNQNRACPNPTIQSFTPQSGPWEGGTMVTITGINLGRKVSDIKQVNVGGSPCVPIPELYIKTKQIVCRTVGTGDDGVRQSGLVIVRIAEYDGISSGFFSYVFPEIHSIEPIYGPLSGGTLLRINGENLAAGSETKVYIDDLPCAVKETENKLIVCKTRPSQIPKNCTLKVQIDNTVKYLTNGTFEYIEDPVILSVHSGISSSHKQAKGTPSGGTNIHVIGRNFRGLQFPRIRVYYNNKSYTAVCHNVDFDTQLKCKAPKIITDVLLDPETPLELEYGFDMADVQSVRKLSNKLGAYLLYPNPVYEKFDGIKNLAADYLTLNGENLDWACTSDEITVRIGKKHCNLISLSRHQLTCRPPSLSELSAGVDAYDVEVKVGRKLLFEIGKISYVHN